MNENIITITDEELRMKHKITAKIMMVWINRYVPSPEGIKVTKQEDVFTISYVNGSQEYWITVFLEKLKERGYACAIA